MKFLIFDTETSGKARDFKLAWHRDLTNFPRIVSLSWFLCDYSGEILSVGNHIVKPDGFEIDKGSIAIHGITQEKAMTYGKPLKLVLDTFLKDYQKDNTTIMVCHNTAFDVSVLLSEINRVYPSSNDYSDPNKKHLTIDTMQPFNQFVGIKNYYGYKWPTLSELHIELFGEDFDGAHNSMEDVKATARCFFEILKRPNVRPIALNQLRKYIAVQPKGNHKLIQVDGMTISELGYFRITGIGRKTATDLGRKQMPEAERKEILDDIHKSYLLELKPHVHQLSKLIETGMKIEKSANPNPIPPSVNPLVEEAKQICMRNMEMIKDMYNAQFGEWREFN